MIKSKLVSDFLEWWAAPRSDPEFHDRFLQPVRYRRGGGVDNEDALWLIQQSPGAEDVQIISAVEEGNLTRVELLSRDPVTGLRHRHRFEILAAGDKIVHVDEVFEMLEDE